MKRGSLEALRGIAALGIALYHSVFLAAPRGNLLLNAEFFVDFFFVLSGFVMALAYAQKVAQGLSFPVFAFLRLARLLPLHVFVMGLWAAWAIIAPGPFAEQTHTIGRFFLNLSLLNAVGLMPVLSWNYQAWSIGAELVAYSVFWIVYARFGRHMNWAWALAVSALAYGIVLANGDTILRTHDLGAVRCVGGFFLGVAVYYLAAKIPSPRALGTRAEALAVLATIGALSMAPGPVVFELVTILALAGVVFVFSSSTGEIARFLNTPVMLFLGRVSYSVYMLHTLFFEIMFHHLWSGPVVLQYGADGSGRYFFATPLAPLVNTAVLAGVVGCAYVTWRWIEEPARKWSKRVVARRVAPSALMATA
ncbi:hypothetical protein ACMU_15380 [Actibacterium mucosum KCTC 23349]|uniref:Acyltransferase 3 domain-containing protein n=1 Tax=Actibacterium mucosum KCTC 23349 TaxID=1454373 RepID=A0A037ZJW6_9RHOB|nr:acyltransferase [Actibacterium mucosum]KAJ55136.1 hypothetical protein ACMU_15380 [Actibacterium mucosum KCTC 23349]